MKQCKYRYCSRSFKPENNYHQFCSESCRTRNALEESEKLTHKRCTCCKIVKSISHYYIRTDIGRPRSRCRRCDSYWKGRTQLQKKERRAFRVGLSVSQMEQELLKTNCDICGDDIADAQCLDHCHTTGVFRGVLCTHCNSGLGYFKDSESNLKQAIEYVRKTKK